MFNFKSLRNAIAVGFIVLLVPVTVLQAGSVVNPASDPLLKMIPADSLFCIRVNNFEYTLSQIDQFLAGASPMPMSIAMLARMQLANVLGSPQINGVNMNGSLVIFGAILPGGAAQTNPISNVFIGGLVPITDYNQFISGNPNCNQPDEKGVSKITSNGTPIMLATQAGNSALVSWANDYNKLVMMAKAISASNAANLTSSLDTAEANLAMTKPIWVFGNVQQASKTFAPLIMGKIEEMKTKIKSIDPKSPEALPGNIQKIAQNTMNMYISILETLMKEVRFLSIALNPKPNVLNITKTISAVPGTDIADMLTADSWSAKENRLLAYLEDGAMMNFAGKMGSPSWKKLNLISIDLLEVMAGDSIKAEDTEKIKTLVENMCDSLDGPIAGSASIDAKNKPPFVAKYIIAVKDEKKFSKVIDEAVEIMKTSSILDFYKGLGIETGFTIQRGVDRYKDVSIDSAKLTMKSTDANSPQGQMINVMYGDGFDYRWGMVDGLWVCTIGSNANSEIRKLIDQVKAGDTKQLGNEMKAALALLPEADKADFLVTYNILRLFKMMTAMAPLPMPQMDIATKSNIAIAGKAGNGKLVADIALPKEHLTEMMTAFITMQQQKMMMQQNLKSSEGEK